MRARASTASGSSSSIREMSFPADRLPPFTSESTRSRTESREPFAGTGSRPLVRLLEERDDDAQRRAGSEDRLDPGSFQLRHVVLRDDPAPDHDDVSGFPLLQEADDFREQGHVRAAQGGQADRVDVLLDGGLDDVLRRLAQAGVYDFHARVPQRASDDLRPSVVSIEAGLRDQHADLLPDRTTSVEEGLLPDAEDFSHHVADLSERRLRPHRVEDERHRVVVGLARLAEAIEGPGMLLRVPGPTKLPEAVHLGLERGLRHPERFHFRLLVDDILVHPDNRAILVLDLALIPIRGVRNLLLEEPFPDCRNPPAEVSDAVEVAIRVFLEFVREGLEEVRAAERVRRVRDA